MRRAPVLLALSLLLMPVQPASAEGPGAVTGTVLMQAMTVSLSLDRTWVEVGKKAGATALVANIGDLRLTSVRATLHGDAALRISPSATRATASIRPHGTWSVRWDVCSMTPGNYLLMASASGVSPRASFTAESAAMLLTVKPGKTKGCP